jgi:hypothetical protein
VPLPPDGERPKRASAGQAYADAVRDAGPYLGLGFQLVGAMAIFAGAGYLLDGSVRRRGCLSPALRLE